MKMIIKSIRLANFKGLETLSLDLNEQVTNISGKNGIGKSTIADAISWCLFGKDAHGNTTFGLKTRGVDGKEIPHLEHYVSLDVILDGKEKNLTRTLKEKWSKPRGSEDEVLTGNVVKYSIDGEECTKADYDKFVFSIAGTDLFPLLSTPDAFCNLHWTKQREILAKMAGEMSEDEITMGEPRFEELLKELQEQTLEAYRKHLSYQIRELKKSIEQMPTKISTLKSTLPDVTLDIDTLEEMITETKARLDEVNKKIVAAKAGASDVFMTKNVMDKINFAERRLLNMETSKRNIARSEAEQHEAELHNAAVILREMKDAAESLKSKRMSLNTLIDKCDEAVKETQTQLAMGTSDWKQMVAEKFIFDDSMTVCPTCGQPLPEEQVREVYEKAKENFNLGKAERKRQLLERADKLRADLEEAQHSKAEYTEELSMVDEQIEGSKTAIEDASKKYDEVVSKPVKTAEDLLNEDANYQNVKAEIKELYKQIENPIPVDNSVLTDLEAEAKKLQDELDMQKRDCSNREQYERISDLIENAKTEWQTLNKQLTALEQKEDVAIEYSNRKDAVLEDKVNSHFKFTKFKLFKTLVNGIDREPFCTATYQGVECANLNTAAKINVGIDILNTLSKYYDTYVPCTVDNAEALNNVEPTISQQILLYVTNDDKLVIQ